MSGVLRAGETTSAGRSSGFAFHQRAQFYPATEAPWSGWVGDTDCTVPQEDYALICVVAASNQFLSRRKKSIRIQEDRMENWLLSGGK